MIAAAAARDLSVFAAFENEFSLLRMGPEGPAPFDMTVFCQTAALDGAAR